MPSSCPNSGKTGTSLTPNRDYEVVDAEIVNRVAESAGLSAGEAARVVDDVVAWYREPVEEYVRRRHAHFQADGKKNDEIFALIAGELDRRVVAAPGLSGRQLRRIVYG